MTGQSGRLHGVGIGGTLRDRSTSQWALERALRAAELQGATTELLALRELQLPMFDPDLELDEYGASVQRLVAAARRADAMIWSTAGYHGSLAAVTKNALEFMQFLAKDTPTYLDERVIGLIATAAGDIAAVNSIGAMVHVAHSLRGMVAPLFVPIPAAQHVFDADGNVVNAKWAGRLDQLGKLVVDMAGRLQPLEAARST